MGRMPRRRQRRVPYTKTSPVTVHTGDGRPSTVRPAYTPAEMAAVVRGATRSRRT